MADQNYPGPYQIRIHYSVTVSGQIFNHQLRLNVAVDGTPEVGADFDAIQVVHRDAIATWNAEIVTEDALTVLYPLFHTSVDFTHAELWRFQPESFVADWISLYPIGEAGSHATAPILGNQLVLTYLTSLGGQAKIDLRHVTTSPGPSLSYPIPAGATKTAMDWFSRAETPYLGRDGGYLAAPRKAHPGQNEKAWKRVNRPR